MASLGYQVHDSSMTNMMNTNTGMEGMNLQTFDPAQSYDTPAEQQMYNGIDYNINPNTNMNNMNMHNQGMYNNASAFPTSNNYGNSNLSGNNVNYDNPGNNTSNANYSNTGNQLGGLNPLAPNVQQRVDSQPNYAQQSLGSYSQQDNGGQQQTQQQSQQYSSSFPQLQQVQQFNSGPHRQLSAAPGAPPNFRLAESSHAATEAASNQRQNNRVPISPMTPRRTSSQANQASPQPPVHNGPMSAVVNMPSRPKPGRRPLPPGQASDRRREQNRSAQRVFRDKRAAKVHDLTIDLEALKKEKKDMEGEYEIILAAKQKELQSMRTQLDEMTKRFRESETKLHHANLAAETAKAAMPAMANNWNISGSNLTVPSELETDFTGLYDSGRSPTNTFPTGMDVDGNCGFCTDPGNCACRAEQEAAAKPTPTPGSCDACQADPERAAACRSLAEQTSFNARGPAAQGPQPFDQTSTSTRMDSMAAPPQPAGRTMSCSKFVDRVGETGTRLPSIPSLFGDKLSSYPAKGDTAMGYDVNEHEAAQVLSNMSRRNTMAADPAMQQ